MGAAYTVAKQKLPTPWQERGSLSHGRAPWVPCHDRRTSAEAPSCFKLSLSPPRLCGVFLPPKTHSVHILVGICSIRRYALLESPAIIYLEKKQN